MSSSSAPVPSEQATVGGHRVTWFAPQRPVEGTGTVFRTDAADVSTEILDTPTDIPRPCPPST